MGRVEGPCGTPAFEFVVTLPSLRTLIGRMRFNTEMAIATSFGPRAVLMTFSKVSLRRLNTAGEK